MEYCHYSARHWKTLINSDLNFKFFFFSVFFRVEFKRLEQIFCFYKMNIFSNFILLNFTYLNFFLSKLSNFHLFLKSDIQDISNLLNVVFILSFVKKYQSKSMIFAFKINQMNIKKKLFNRCLFLKCIKLNYNNSRNII